MLIRSLLLAELLSTPWAIEPARLAAIESVVVNWYLGRDAAPDVMAAVALDAADVLARRDAAAHSPHVANGVAVIPIYGILAQRANMVSNMSGPGGTSTQQVSNALRAAISDPDVGGVLLDVDSPGGSVVGIQELADEIHAARDVKPVFAFANGTAASAAYWLATQATELHVTPSGEVGSIGVYGAHKDLSAALEKAGVKTTLISAGKYKVEGNPYEPLADDARAFMQSKVDDHYATFVKAVARGRGVGVGTVRDDMGGGRSLGAAAALAAGMVDGVGTMGDVVARLAKAMRPTASQAPVNRPPRNAALRRALDLSALS